MDLYLATFAKTRESVVRIIYHLRKFAQFARLQRQLNREHNMEKSVNDFLNYYKQTGTYEDMVEHRKRNVADLVQKYYHITSPFFECFWGPSFHTFPLRKGEDFPFSLKKHDYRLALKGGFKSGDKIVDLGSGIGGPARNIAEFTGAHVTGLTISPVQVERATQLTKDERLEHLVTFTQGDFCNAPFEANSFDKAYSIEAMCHAADLKEFVSEVYRLLKPGGIFVLHDVVKFTNFGSTPEDDRRMTEAICLGGGLAEMRYLKDYIDLLKEGGFQILDQEDMMSHFETHQKYELSLWGFRVFYAAMKNTLIPLFTKIGIIPKGTAETGKIFADLLDVMDEVFRKNRQGTTMMVFVLQKGEKRTDK